MFIGSPSVTGNEMEDTVLQLKDQISKLEGGNYLNLLFTVAGMRNVKKMKDEMSSKKKSRFSSFHHILFMLLADTQKGYNLQTGGRRACCSL